MRHLKVFQRKCFLMLRSFIRNNSWELLYISFLYWFFITVKFWKDQSELSVVLVMQSVVCNNTKRTVNNKENKGMEEGIPFQVWLCIGNFRSAVTSFLVGLFCSFLTNKWIINYLVSPGTQLNNSSFISLKFLVTNLTLHLSHWNCSVFQIVLVLGAVLNFKTNSFCFFA